MSGSEPEKRPRPQFGEYATPEEQQAAIKQPADWQIEASRAAAGEGAPQPVDEQHPEVPRHPFVPGPAQPPSPQHPHPSYEQFQGQGYLPPRAPRRASPWDRFLTFVLLGFGLYNVVSMVMNAVSGGEVMRQSADMVGNATEEQAIAALPAWIWTATAVAYALIWLVALSASLRALRSGRAAAWIPFVAGVVALVLALAFIVIGLGENPDLLNIVPSPTSGSGSPT
ncbi:MAG: DUF6264 family protein [Microbacteriaceae bacterium]|nr:DUF6264 family protein [Microbacteriaceae bacterium]MCL2794058.1 DUF6264 family protein [Microbacteriaceae bacterium]